MYLSPSLFKNTKQNDYVQAKYVTSRIPHRDLAAGMADAAPGAGSCTSLAPRSTKSDHASSMDVCASSDATSALALSTFLVTVE